MWLIVVRLFINITTSSNIIRETVIISYKIQFNFEHAPRLATFVLLSFFLGFQRRVSEDWKLSNLLKPSVQPRRTCHLCSFCTISQLHFPKYLGSVIFVKPCIQSVHFMHRLRTTLDRVDCMDIVMARTKRTSL